MAPRKFGIFRSRSRDQPEQPSTENLLRSSLSIDTVNSPVQEFIQQASSSNFEETNRKYSTDIEMEGIPSSSRRASASAIRDGAASSSCEAIYEVIQHPLMSAETRSTVMSSNSTLQDPDNAKDSEESSTNIEDLDQISTLTIDEGASTSYDASSRHFDDSTVSIAPSEDQEVNCSALRRKKHKMSAEAQFLHESEMWRASNLEVMENLLKKSGTLDDQIKWQAIANARGLCTLTDNCRCVDCQHTKYLLDSDGDGGLGAAPLFSAIAMGPACVVQ